MVSLGLFCYQNCYPQPNDSANTTLTAVKSVTQTKFPRQKVFLSKLLPQKAIIPESSHVFFQGQKCEPSRVNGKFLSKTTYIGLPPPKSYHSKQIPRVPMPFSKAKNASLREQMENLRARQHCRLATTKPPSFQTNSESFHVFLQSKKCKPSRTNGKSLSTPTYIGLPPPKPHHSKPISRVPMPFSKAKKCEPSRANGNSQSKPTFVGLRLSAHP